MLSYTKFLKDSLDPSIYNQGLRIYLQGGVSNPTSLVLDNWRLYTVIERNYYHQVKLPLLHLALDQSKFQDAYKCIREVAQCDCEYFAEHGLCRHIVAVLAAIEKEFNQTTELTRQAPPKEDILDSIFTAQKVKVHRKWLATMDTLLQSASNNYYHLDKISKAVKEEPGEHGDFFQQLSTILEPHVGLYSKEKRILKIALESILIGKYQFWNFFLPIVFRFDEDLQLQFWINMWKFYWMGACEGYKDDVVSHLRELPRDQKKQVLEALLQEYARQKELYLEFCFVSRYYIYLMENKEVLSETDLIRLTEHVPDMREDTDIVLSGHLRTWSDFLKAGEYQDFLKIVHLWSDKLGKSEIFVDTLKYIIRSHPKKKSLTRKLQDLI